MELMQASHQWSKRPKEERFTNLTEMKTACEAFKARSITRSVPNRSVRLAPVDGDNAAMAMQVNGMTAVPNHWAFGQLCSLVGAPAGYLRKLPTPLSADCVNYGLHVERDVEEIGTMIVQGDEGEPDVLHAATGPNFGRVWNSEVLDRIIDNFGDGIEGRFTVPGEFGKKVDVTTENTTLYRSDRDMFLFLADEERRIEIPNRRNGKPGGLARGFFVQNSEVGAASLKASTFLFDYACSNRIVWGAEEFAEIRISHTSGAPLRWIEEVIPALKLYADSATHRIDEAIKMAQAKRLAPDGDAVTNFLANRYSVKAAKGIQLAHAAEENGRPIETVWDAVTGITAWAKASAYTADRVDIERDAGKLLESVL